MEPSRKKKQSALLTAKLAAWIALTATTLLLLGGAPFVAWLDRHLETRVFSDLYHRFRIPQITGLTKPAPPPISQAETNETELPLPHPDPIKESRPADKLLGMRQSGVDSPSFHRIATLAGPAHAETLAKYGMRYTPMETAGSGTGAAGVSSESISTPPVTPMATSEQREELCRIAPMVTLSGGVFFMGADEGKESDHRPKHEVSLMSFQLDRHEVTNRQFRLFVNATGYRTTAERRGWSYVFDAEQRQWIRKIGACWWNPQGRPSEAYPENPALVARWDHPVVHVSWDDANAFCGWAGKRLPTEAEWEYAAKAGRVTAIYPWGDRREEDGRFAANLWQGVFPRENSVRDGFPLTAPVESFAPSPNGLYDLGGNVAEWCTDCYAAGYYRRSPRNNPTGPLPEEAKCVDVPRLQVAINLEGEYVIDHEEEYDLLECRTVRGGSFLSTENNGAAYRVHARSWQPRTLSYNDLGFRCAADIGLGE